MQNPPFAEWVCDPSLPTFVPERFDEDMKYWALRCPCGAERFRASGWPQSAAGSGSYFWRTLARVWREARLPVREGEPIESPFALPLQLECDACGRDGALFAGAAWEALQHAEAAAEPREAYRCRVCRRAVVEIVVGISESGGVEDGPMGFAGEVVARCAACRRQARIAWRDVRPSPQELRLDRLYGRR